MEKFIKAAVESEREFDKVRKKPSDVKVKEEPMAKIDKKTKKVDKKERHCFRCREARWTKEHGKVCKAMKHECEVCGKIGHLEKLCRKAKKRTKKSNELTERAAVPRQKQLTRKAQKQGKCAE